MSSDGLDLPSGVVRGALTLPGSKSGTNRLLVMALFARQPVRLVGALRSADTAAMARALETLGFGVAEDGEALVLTPGPPPPRATIDCGASGTMLRFLTAVLCTIPGAWRLDGVPRLRQRPMGPLVQALRELGADVQCVGGAGLAPIEVVGGSLRGGGVALDAGESSQFVSALLLAGLGAREPVEVTVERLTSRPYVDLTLEAIGAAGGRVSRRADRFRVEPGPVRGGVYRVEPDLSSAGYAAAGAALTGGEVEIKGVSLGSRQPDARFLALLESMGARLRSTPGGLQVRGRRLRAVTVDAGNFPDQVPTLAAIAPFASGTTEILGVGHLRLKESDRLQAMSAVLRAAGATVAEQRAALVIPGVWAEEAAPSPIAELDPCGDHRIAMSAAVLALRRPGLRLTDPGVVVKSYPDFWQDWFRIVSS
jgi:3-phosphoshikimate 1-carboxyvinyltransferase